MTRLTLLIPTLAEREPYLSRLLAQLELQRVPGVEIIPDRDAGEVSIGAKRNRLLASAAELNAGWVTFIDDDDAVAGDYVARILSAATVDADVLGFRSRVFIDGVLSEQVVHSYGASEVPVRHVRGTVRRDRPPNHLNPVRLSFALRAGFPDRNYGEDTEYARRLARLRPRERFLDWYAYDHLFRSARGGEMTNARHDLVHHRRRDGHLEHLA